MFGGVRQIGLVAISALLISIAGCGDSAPTLAERAADYRADLGLGDEVGRISFPSSDAPVLVLSGLTPSTLDRGPGWFQRSMLPGQGGMVYVAGHRTTRGAPFQPVGRLRAGDAVRFDLPYALATYVVTRRAFVNQRDVGILSQRRDTEQLRLQTSTVPASSRRLIVFANLSTIDPR
jgi:LPXTG-site transpeptidase (sortase) family protein